MAMGQRGGQTRSIASGILIAGVTFLVKILIWFVFNIMNVIVLI